VSRWLRERGVTHVVERDWDHAADWRGARFTCIPAQHFSGRSLTGRDRTLWCGWLVQCANQTVMFAGDTGLHPEFERVSADYGPISVAILPIGAYDPRWFMRPVHMDPHEAVAAYGAISNVNADKPCTFIPSHWGTFVLTDEPVDEPPRALLDAWNAAGLDAKYCVILRPGESHLHSV
jgi:N-acyl-phosphatidylethanolamine-hydrolysing phospholipase D